MPIDFSTIVPCMFLINRFIIAAANSMLEVVTRDVHRFTVVVVL